MVPDGWKRTTIGNVSKVTSGGTPSRSVPEYWNGEIPWVTTGLINFNVITKAVEYITKEGLANSSAKMFPPKTLLVALYGDGVTRGKVAMLGIDAATNQACAAILPSNNVLPEYAFYYIATNYEALRRESADGNQKNLSGNLIKGYPLLLPPLPEQQKIAAILSTWDRAIELTEKLIAAKQKRKQALMQQLLTGKVRFAEFVKSDETFSTRYGDYPADWQYIKIEKVASQVSEKNTDGTEHQVLSCTKYDGLVDSLTYFGKQIFSDDLSTYKIVRRNHFAYATNHIEEGSIGYQNVCDVAVISPMYTVFKTNQRIVDDGFLYKLLKSDLYVHIYQVNTSASVDRRGSLRWTAFSHIRIPLPSLEEQRAIAAVLDGQQHEIDLLSRKRETLQQQKKGLMQQLLMGNIRVNMRDLDE
ncbi:MAG: type I restriction endonuclease subunit R [Gimesia sp.]|nr:type I restriction endonuclease subunit R [Gimesia sp.]